VATEAQPAKQAKLLIVEDDVMVRVVLADMLCELGYTVAAEAASIDAAILRSSTLISRTGLSRRLPMPSSPATYGSSSSRATETTGLPAYCDRPTLRKPFQMDALKRALQERPE